MSDDAADIRSLLKEQEAERDPAQAEADADEEWDRMSTYEREAWLRNARYEHDLNREGSEGP